MMHTRIGLAPEAVVWIVLPVFNEAEGLPNWIKTLNQVFPDSQHVRFVVSDDGSTDALQDAIDRLRSEIPQIEVLGDGKNHGPGHAFSVGFTHILQKGKPGDVVITLEADGTADTSSIALMLTSLHQADVVLASVYLPGGGFSQTSTLRLFLSNMANALMRTTLRLPYRTLTSFYRAYRFEALEKVNSKFPGILQEKGFICQVEMLVKCRKTGLSLAEVPTKVFTERRIGVSKMRLLRTSLSHLRFLAVTLMRQS